MKRLFLLLAMTFMLSTNFAAPQKTYTRAQVDSIVAVEVKQQLNHAVAVEVQKQLAAQNAQIELLVEKSSQDRLGTYITEQNNQLTRQNTHFTILIAVLMAILGVGAPLLINRQYEKRLDKIAKQNEERIDASLSQSKVKLDKIVRKNEKRIDTSLLQSKEKLSEIAKQNEEKISEDIATKTSGLNTQTIELNRKILALNENIKNHDETIKKSLDQQEKLKTEIEEMRKQVEKLAGEAEKSKNEARKAEQAAKASELFSKAYNEKDVDKRIELYTEVLKISPNDADAINNLGVAYSDKGEYDLAIEKYNQLIGLGLGDYVTYYNRSIAYVYKKDLAQAIKDLKQSINLSDSYEDSKLGLEIVQDLQTIKNLMEENKLEEAHKKAIEAMEIAKGTNDDSNDWVKIVERKIKEIKNLQKQDKP